MTGPRALTCGCCTGGCTCATHADIPNGRPVFLCPAHNPFATDDDAEDDRDVIGYHDCDCCGDVTIDARVCDACVKAGCEPNDHGGENDGIYDDCQIPVCDVCDVRASLMNDGRWHSNCDAPCANAGKDWAS